MFSVLGTSSVINVTYEEPGFFFVPINDFNISFDESLGVIDRNTGLEVTRTQIGTSGMKVESFIGAFDDDIHVIAASDGSSGAFAYLYTFEDSGELKRENVFNWST